jgi:hypothetical protein
MKLNKVQNFEKSYDKLKTEFCTEKNERIRKVYIIVFCKTFTY